MDIELFNNCLFYSYKRKNIDYFNYEYQNLYGQLYIFSFFINDTNIYSIVKISISIQHNYNNSYFYCEFNYNLLNQAQEQTKINIILYQINEIIAN
jgi:hypothetical protein